MSIVIKLIAICVKHILAIIPSVTIFKTTGR